MGINDELSFTLICPECGATESSSVCEKGSRWGGSWDQEASFSRFKTQWSGGGKHRPVIITAVCNQCGSNATVKTKYL
jgi:hypothetical protein